MKVLIVGDVIVDHYVYGSRLGISAETPTIVAKYSKEDVFLGGAGLVARNLLRLGCEVVLLTISDNMNLKKYITNSSDTMSNEELSRLTIHNIFDINWNITEKKRYFVDQYKLLQFDIINEGKNFDVDTFSKHFCKYINSDVVVICDNNHGVLSQDIASFIISKCDDKDKCLYVDSQISQSKSKHRYYDTADYIFMNDKEVDNLLHELRVTDLRELSKILHSTIVHKRGENGARIINYNYSKVVSGLDVPVIDTCGAGDAFMAAFISSRNDLSFANKWAALSVTHRGTIVPELYELNKLERNLL